MLNTASLDKSVGFKKKNRRFWELDFIRGICVLLMVFDHFMQFMVFLDNDKFFKVYDFYMNNSVRNFFHLSVRIVFFLICGISCVLSRSNAKRGMQLFGVACFLTFFTIMLDTMNGAFSGATIYFGVLHMLGVAILICSFLLNTSKLIPIVGKYIPLIVGVLCLFFYYYYINGKSGDRSLGYFPAIVGYNVPHFFSGDYSPLFPEMAYVFIGATIGQFYRTRHKYFLARLNGGWNKPICFVGRHALFIYLTCPILCYIVFFIIAS